MDPKIYYIIGGIIVVFYIFAKLFLNKPSKLQKENQDRMKRLKNKKKVDYNEVRKLPKDRKKY